MVTHAPGATVWPPLKCSQMHKGHDRDSTDRALACDFEHVCLDASSVRVWEGGRTPNSYNLNPWQLGDIPTPLQGSHAQLEGAGSVAAARDPPSVRPPPAAPCRPDRPYTRVCWRLKSTRQVTTGSWAVSGSGAAQRRPGAQRKSKILYDIKRMPLDCKTTK